MHDKEGVMAPGEPPSPNQLHPRALSPMSPDCGAWVVVCTKKTWVRSTHPVAQSQPLFVQRRGVLHGHPAVGAGVAAVSSRIAAACLSAQTAYMSTASSPPIPPWHRPSTTSSMSRLCVALVAKQNPPSNMAIQAHLRERTAKIIVSDVARSAAPHEETTGQ